MGLRTAVALWALGLLAHGSAVAQEQPAEPYFHARIVPAGLFPTTPIPSPAEMARPVVRGYGNPDRAFLASLAVPGTGQYMLGQMRWVPYVLVETYGWIRFTERRSTAGRLADRYRDLAWTAARQASGGVRRDTTFGYYELLTKATRSGAFDAQPAVDGLQPEADPGTYNGEQWRLARALFIPLGSAGTPGTPGYDSALGYYMAHAIPAVYAFAWTAEADRRRYGELIEDSDDAYSASTIVLGLLLANHLTSSIDALISARLRKGGKDLHFESGIAPDGRGDVWSAPLRLETGVRYSW